MGEIVAPVIEMKKTKRKPVCSRCNINNVLEKKRYCKVCNAEYMRNWRKTHRPNDDQVKKGIVRSTTNMLVRRGKITKKPCEVCGGLSNLEAHHDDYSKPEQVRWLCAIDHKEHHNVLLLQKKMKEKILIDD